MTPRRVVVPRLLRRSLGRIVRRTELSNGNREGLNALVGRDSVIARAIKQHRATGPRTRPGRPGCRTCGRARPPRRTAG